MCPVPGSSRLTGSFRVTCASAHSGTCVATPGFVFAGFCGGRHDITPLVLARRHSGVEVTVTSVGASRGLRSSWDPPCPRSCII